MMVDGRQIAEDILAATKEVVDTLPRQPQLLAFTCAPNFETRRYLALKKRKAAEIGIEVEVKELPETITTAEVVEGIIEATKHTDAIVVQLPFPLHIDVEEILAAIPEAKDPDGFGYVNGTAFCVPPVAGAVAEIADRYGITFAQKTVVVLGHGRLVGQPVAQLLRNLGANVTVLTEQDGDPTKQLRHADVIVSGIGKPHFITSDMVKPGVDIFDAGTSEDGGLMVGDVDPAVASITALFTPVPGGIGPITVAILLRNVVSLMTRS
jgi:methylenetetrahydrofolate dehydrogenase (NADP+) / methenyltetrahydrofolate cyclohydrolase